MYIELVFDYHIEKVSHFSRQATDMTPKPAYYTIKNLFEKTWHTETEITSDADGNAKFKGFYGKYDAAVELDGKTITKEINFTKKSGKRFEIII